jgi:ferric-dicitrate binding protein FerR (iron transport regulator)
LPDGSKVWLNAASSIRYPTTFAGDERKVELTGEAYFEVAKDPKKPFHVKTPTQDIEVLGTHFNVNAYEDEGATKTTLLEGKVRLVSGEWAAGSRKADMRSVILNPGQQAIAAININAPIHVTDDIDLDQIMAWKNGWFEFDNTDIKTIMRQISRWYDVDIRYETKTNNETYGGRISRNLNLSSILKMLETYGVHYRLEGKTVSIIR